MRTGDANICEEIDREFVWKLAQRGKVEVLSHQVTITSSDGISLEGIKIPKGCEVQYAFAKPTRDEYKPEVQITFRFLDKESEPEDDQDIPH